jgi:hypothetical protein
MTTGPEKPGVRYVLHLTEEEMSSLIFCVDTTVKAAGTLFVRQAAAIMAECDHAFAAADQVQAAFAVAHGDKTEEELEAAREVVAAAGKLH